MSPDPPSQNCLPTPLYKEGTDLGSTLQCLHRHWYCDRPSGMIGGPGLATYFMLIKVFSVLCMFLKLSTVVLKEEGGATGFLFS